MRISNPPNPAISTSLLSTVGMKPTRDAAIDFILPFPNGIQKQSAGLSDTDALAPPTPPPRQPNSYHEHRGHCVHPHPPPSDRRHRVGATESAGLSRRARTRPWETCSADLRRPGIPFRGVDPGARSNPGRPPRNGI